MASDVTTPTSPPHEQGPPQVGGVADEVAEATSGSAELDKERRNDPQPPSGAMNKGPEEQTRGRGEGGRGEGGSEEPKEDSVQVHVGK